MTTGPLAERGALTDRRTRLGEAMAGIMARDSSRPNIFRRGDLFEGIVAVVALLLMVALGVAEWLAIILAIATFVGVALLRPPGKRRDEPDEDTVAEEVTRETPSVATSPPQPDDAATLVYRMVAKDYGLTRRESEILPMLERRLTDKEIAERLGISDRTAMNHSANVLAKLELDSRREVADFIARYRQMLPPSSPNADE